MFSVPNLVISAKSAHKNPLNSRPGGCFRGREGEEIGFELSSLGQEQRNSCMMEEWTPNKHSHLLERMLIMIFMAQTHQRWGQTVRYKSRPVCNG